VPDKISARVHRSSAGRTQAPKVTPTLSLLQVIGYNLLIVSAVLVLRACQRRR
jgi:hypothetical protein